MPEKQVIWRCTQCRKPFDTYEAALACENQKGPGFKAGDHIALNGNHPEQGRMGFIRWIGHRVAHQYFAVLARTDSRSPSARRDAMTDWYTFLGGGEKLVSPPDRRPEEPPWDIMPEWTREKQSADGNEVEG